MAIDVGMQAFEVFVDKRRLKRADFAIDNQPFVPIHVLQGERELLQDCRSLARFKVLIDPQPAGMPRVEVTFMIDANGILNVAASDMRTGHERSVEVKPSYGLTDEEIERLLEESIDFAEDDVSVAPDAELLRRIAPIATGVAQLERVSHRPCSAGFFMLFEIAELFYPVRTVAVHVFRILRPLFS